MDPRSGVFQMPKYGGAINTIAEQSGSFVSGLGANHESIFWVKEDFVRPEDVYDTVNIRYHSHLMQREIAEGSPTELHEGNFQSGSSGLFVGKFQISDRALYVPVSYLAAPESITGMPLDGSPVSHLYFMKSPALVSDDILYISVGDPIDGLRLQTQIPGETNARRFVSIAGATLGDVIGADATSLYLAVKNVADKKSRIVRVEKKDGAQTTLNTISPPGRVIPELGAVDDNNVYFLVSGESRIEIRSVPITGGASMLIGLESIDSCPLSDLYFAATCPYFQQLEQDSRNLFLVRGRVEVILVPKLPPGCQEASANRETCLFQ